MIVGVDRKNDPKSNSKSVDMEFYLDEILCQFSIITDVMITRPRNKDLKVIAEKIGVGPTRAYSMHNKVRRKHTRRDTKFTCAQVNGTTRRQWLDRIRKQLIGQGVIKSRYVCPSWSNYPRWEQANKGDI